MVKSTNQRTGQASVGSMNRIANQKSDSLTFFGISHLSEDTLMQITQQRAESIAIISISVAIALTVFMIIAVLYTKYS